MRRLVKTVLTLLMSLALCVPVMGCGEDEGEEITLLVDLHGWMPSNSNITSAGSQPYTATQALADEFMKTEKNIKIKWATTKPVGDDADTIATWFTTRITTDSCPAIAFTWGTQYQDRDWYVSLDEYLDTPNEYQSGNKKWRDMFEDYLFSLDNVADVKGRVVALPLVLYAGTATGYYYNENLVREAAENNSALAAQLAQGKSLAELMDTYTKFTDVIGAVQDEFPAVTRVAPSSDVGGIVFGSWIQNFCLGPSYAGKLMSVTDYDKDGTVSGEEQVRATLEGHFNPVTYDGAKEMLARLYDYYNGILDQGWQNRDHDSLWKTGNAAFKESGIWSYNTEASTVHGSAGNTYEWGVIPSPIISTDSGSPYVSEIEHTVSGFSECTPDLQVNIMKPAVEGKPKVLEAAVKFLKFLTTVENNEYMIGAKDSGLPSVKGAEYPATITESGYMEQSFPIKPRADWPTAFTSDRNFVLNREFRSWVSNTSVDPWDFTASVNTEFYRKVNEAQTAGAKALAAALGVDTAGWNII